MRENGLQKLLTCVTYSTCSSNSISHFRGEWQLLGWADKVTAFKAKLEWWGWWVNIGIFDMFQTLIEILKETEPGLSFSQLVHDHLSQLSKVCDEYCFLSQKTPKLGRNGSATHLWIHFVLEEDQLLQVANGCGLESMSDTTSDLHTFWIKVKAEYPETATGALKSLLPFPTSYLRQVGFSSVTATDFRWQSLPSSPDRTI